MQKSVLLNLLGFILFTGSFSYASDGVIWEKTYGGQGIDVFRCIIQTDDGGFVLAGYSDSFSTGGSDFWLVKTDASGNLEWSQTYDEVGYQKASSVVQTRDGGFALAGSTRLDIGGPFSSMLVKTNSEGILEWSQTYRGDLFGQLYDLVEVVTGGFALAGCTSSDMVMVESWLVKTDALGNLEWSQTYGEFDAFFRSLIQTNDGGFAVAGETGSSKTSGDSWLVKTDASGNLEWSQTYGGTGTDRFWSIVSTSDEGFALAGDTNSYGAGDQNFWLVKTDASGNLEWSQTYGGTGTDKCWSVAVTDNGFAMVGSTVSSGQQDFLVIKTDSIGEAEWSQIYGEDQRDEAYCVLPVTNDVLAVAGRSLSLESWSTDARLILVKEAKYEDIGPLSIEAEFFRWGENFIEISLKNPDLPISNSYIFLPSTDITLHVGDGFAVTDTIEFSMDWVGSGFGEAADLLGDLYDWFTIPISTNLYGILVNALKVASTEALAPSDVFDQIADVVSDTNYRFRALTVEEEFIPMLLKKAVETYSESDCWVLAPGSVLKIRIPATWLVSGDHTVDLEIGGCGYVLTPGADGLNELRYFQFHRPEYNLVDVQSLDLYWRKELSKGIFDLVLGALCPVELEVTDPEGRIISSSQNQIPDAEYFTIDLDRDGDPDSYVSIGNATEGQYDIQIIPKPNRTNQETYSLFASTTTTTTWLAQNQTIEDSPAEGFLLDYQDGEVIPEITSLVTIILLILFFYRKSNS